MGNIYDYFYEDVWDPKHDRSSLLLVVKLAYQKCQETNMLTAYPYLEKGKQLCHPHYCAIVEFKHNQNKHKRKKKSKEQEFQLLKKTTNEALMNDPTFALKIKTLTNVLYNKQYRKGANLELEPQEFEKMVENISPKLKGFFPTMVNTIIPKERSAHNKQEAKKSIVALCYMIAGLQNKFVNQFKTEVGLYLAASGATWDAIDTISSLGYSACSKTIEKYHKKIQKEYTIKVEQYFIENKIILHIYNIDDYHSIYEICQPNAVSTSLAKHFATCVAKPVDKFPSVLLIFNGISIYNPSNVEAPRICWYLINKYTGVFDISYLEYQKHWISQRQLVIHQLIELNY
ncbi:hypothetical protein Glove_300g81 [Diversispora epigaea]|uniref:Uncharacterized protein n=1 Tax=Diversispora epigaea TaxID=1348612 RepID=A0A397I457_9GLOM|nr:hypothetical protein Glove_300g81 [Diversispora epigaea]